VRWLSLLCCGLLTDLTGCASMVARRQFESFPLLAPAAFGAEAIQMQRLTTGRIGGGDTITMDAAVEVDAAEVRIAGLLLGQRVLLLVWDGEHLAESRDPVVPASLDGRSIVRDLQLVYWP